MDEVDAYHTTIVFFPDHVLDVVQVDYLVAHPQQPTHGPPPPQSRGPGHPEGYPGPITYSTRCNDDTFGVLELTLHPKSYDWEFVPVEGDTFSDSGSARCH